MSPNLPLAPAVTAPGSTRAGNPLLDWLNVKDSTGAALSHYRLNLDTAFYSIPGQVFTVFIELAYAIFLVMTTVSTAALQLVLNPRLWLEPLSKAYITLTKPIYELVPPQLIVVGTFIILIFQVYAIRSGPAPGTVKPGKTKTLLDQWIPSNTQIARAQWDRLGSGVMILALVMLLTADPFGSILKLLETVVSAGEMFIPGRGSAASYQSVNSGNLVQTVTFLINYRDILDPECAQQWANSINSSGGNPLCLTKSQLAATRPDVWTVLLAGAAVPCVGWPVAKFAFLVVTRFLNYASLAVAYLVAAGYVAAVTLGRRRPFDPLVTTVSRLATNAGMAILVIIVAELIPSWFYGLINAAVALLPTPQDNAIISGSVATLRVAAIAASYWATTKLFSRYFEIKENLVSLFKDRIRGHAIITNLYDLKATDQTLASHVMQPLNAPITWSKDRYQQFVGWKDRARDQVGQFLTGGDRAATMIEEETPEMRGAQETATLGAASAPRKRVPIDVLAAKGEREKRQHEPPPPPVNLTATGEVRPVPLPPSGTAAAPPDQAVAVYRAGIPVMLTDVPTDMRPPPELIAGPGPSTPMVSDSPEPPPPAPATAWEAAARELRADALAIQPAASERRDDEQHQLDAVLREHSVHTVQSGASESELRAAAAKVGLLQGPNFTMVLSPAAWVQAARHYRNLAAARGHNIIPTLSEEAEGHEHSLFGERGGRPTMIRKHDRGF